MQAGIEPQYSLDSYSAELGRAELCGSYTNAPSALPSYPQLRLGNMSALYNNVSSMRIRRQPNSMGASLCHNVLQSVTSLTNQIYSRIEYFMRTDAARDLFGKTRSAGPKSKQYLQENFRNAKNAGSHAMFQYHVLQASLIPSSRALNLVSLVATNAPKA